MGERRLAICAGRNRNPEESTSLFAEYMPDGDNPAR
jgi:hypothetical protein